MQNCWLKEGFLNLNCKLFEYHSLVSGKSRFYYSWSHFERFSLNYFEILSDREKVGLILIVSCSLILYFIYFILHFKYLMFLRDGEDTNSKPTDGVV